MDRRLAFVADEADRAVALRIMDICSSAEKWHKPCFSHFLTESEQAAAKELLRYQFDDYHYFYGGWMDEEDRKNRTNTQDKYEEIIKRIELQTRNDGEII